MKLPPYAPLEMETTETYKQFWWAGCPVTGRIPLPGKRCGFLRHNWVLEEYPGVKLMDRDMVCTKCPARKILKGREFLPGEKPDYKTYVANAMRSHISQID